MTHGRRVWGDTAAGAAAAVVTTATGLLVLGLSTRVLGSHDWGLWAGALAWAMTTATLFHLSLGQVAIHHLTHDRGEETLQRMLVTLVGFTLLLTLAGWIACGIGWWASEGRLFGGIPGALVALVLLGLPFLLWAPYGLALYQSTGRLPLHSIFAAGGGIVTLLVAFLLLQVVPLGVAGLAIASVAGGLAFFVASVAALRKPSSNEAAVSWPRMPDLGLARKLLGHAKVLHATAIGAFIFASSDLLLINEFRSPDEVGWYQLASTLINGAMIVPAALASSLSSLTARLGPAAAWPHNRKTLLQVGGLTVAGAIVGYPLVPIVVAWLAGPGYAPAVGVTRILLLALLGMTVSSLLSPQVIARGMFRTASIITLGIGLANFAVNLVVIPRWGITGAAWSKAACYTVILLTNLYFAFVVFPKPPPTGTPVEVA